MNANASIIADFTSAVMENGNRFSAWKYTTKFQRFIDAVPIRPRRTNAYHVACNVRPVVRDRSALVDVDANDFRAPSQHQERRRTACGDCTKNGEVDKSPDLLPPLPVSPPAPAGADYGETATRASGSVLENNVCNWCTDSAPSSEPDTPPDDSDANDPSEGAGTTVAPTTSLAPRPPQLDSNGLVVDGRPKDNVNDDDHNLSKGNSESGDLEDEDVSDKDGSTRGAATCSHTSTAISSSHSSSSLASSSSSDRTDSSAIPQHIMDTWASSSSSVSSTPSLSPAEESDQFDEETVILLEEEVRVESARRDVLENASLGMGFLSSLGYLEKGVVTKGRRIGGGGYGDIFELDVVDPYLNDKVMTFTKGAGVVLKRINKVRVLRYSRTIIWKKIGVNNGRVRRGSPYPLSRITLRI